MKPLCADCGTEHQPCDHPADQWPVNRTEGAGAKLKAYRDNLLSQSQLARAEAALDRVLYDPREDLDEIAIINLTTIRGMLIQFRSKLVKREMEREAELLNLIEKGPSHDG